MPRRNITQALDALFDRWVATYPEDQRAGFHRDGIIDEPEFAQQRRRILFVLLEPNSRGGAYDRYFGRDLRELFRQEPIAKSMTSNLALWTQALLDGRTDYSHLNAEESRTQLRRVAVLNLKKIAGSGKADVPSIAIHAWDDRALIREEVELIGAETAVTCGEVANRLFGFVMGNDKHRLTPGDAAWPAGKLTVIPGNHPSLRPRNAESALGRLITRARETDIV